MPLASRIALLVIVLVLAACGGGDKEQPQIGPIPGHTGVVSNASFDPQIAVDGNGNAFAVWAKFDGTRKNIWANRYVAGSGWGRPQMIENDNAGDADLPQIAFDAAGNAVAIWRHTEIVTAGVPNPSGKVTNCKPSRVAIGGIWVNRYDAIKQLWAGAQKVETKDSAVIEIIINPDDSELCKLIAHDAQNPHIAADGKGNFVAVWEQSDGVRKNIRANRYDAVAGKWGATPDTIEANTADANSPQIAADGKGNFVAVWRQIAASSVIPNQYDSVQNKRYNLWGNRYDVASQRWGGATLVSDNTLLVAGDPSNPNVNGNADTPHVAMDANGNALAVWAQSNHIFANRYDAATQLWGVAPQFPQSVENNPGWAAAAPRIAMTGGGDALVVWEQYFDNDPHDHIPAWKNIRANRYIAGVGWQAAQLIENDDKGHALTPQAVIDANGNAIAIWRYAETVVAKVEDDPNTPFACDPRVTIGSIRVNHYDAIRQQWVGAQQVSVQRVGTENDIVIEEVGSVCKFKTGPRYPDASNPHIALDATGNALAVWSQSNGVRTLIDANRYAVGVGWGSAELIEGQ
ncbi:MAG: hypothetical protein M3A44_06245 [Gammaproteobacteria bacterium]